MNPVVLRDRLVAFFDVLGFSARLQGGSLEDLYFEHMNFITSSSSMAFRRSVPFPAANPNPRIFAHSSFLFDSVLLVSRPIRHRANVCRFALGAIKLMMTGFQSGMPLRGAIGLGSFMAYQQGRILLSEAIPPLLAAEKAQEWSGCVILPNADHIMLEALFSKEARPSTNLSPSARDPLVLFNVPLKAQVAATSLRGQRWCLNWAYGLDNVALRDGLGKLNSEKRPSTEAFVGFVYGLREASPMPLGGDDYMKAITTPTTYLSTMGLKANNDPIVRNDNLIVDYNYRAGNRAWARAMARERDAP